MQNTINATPAGRKNYDFIDAIRCIAMMSIVAEHSISLGLYHLNPGSAKYWTYIAAHQLVKFGTVAFFLLAGFLISEKFTDYTPGQYLKRRFSTTFGPWVFWSLLYIAIMIANMALKERIYHRGEFTVSNILSNIKIVYLYTNYWFIINFLISISVLLVFRRYLYSLYLGGGLLSFTLFYTVNIHYEWIAPGHTVALLGFVFFLWLGAQLRKNWQYIEDRVSKLSYLTILFLLLVTYALAVFEFHWLNGHSKDPLNTLRISNLLYSLTFFLLLLRAKNLGFTKFLRPRETTYGIYLIHYIILMFVISEIFGHFKFDAYAMNIPQFIAFKLFTFLAAYSLTIGVVMLINRTRLRVLVGS